MHNAFPARSKPLESRGVNWKHKHKYLTHKGCKHLVTCNQCERLRSSTGRAAALSGHKTTALLNTDSQKAKRSLLTLSERSRIHISTRVRRKCQRYPPPLYLQRVSRSRQKDYSILDVSSHASCLYTGPDQYCPPIAAPQHRDTTETMGSILT